MATAYLDLEERIITIEPASGEPLHSLYLLERASLEGWLKGY
jgi:hypothetical protein